MQVILKPGTKDILSLYTPFAGFGKLRVDHTRSVLLRQDETKEDHFTIISSVTFILVISLPKRVPLDYLLKYMIMAYARSLYSSMSKQSEKSKHLPIYSSETIGEGVKRFLARIDRQNCQDYEYVRAMEKEQEEQEWRWYPCGSRAIEDTEYREMRNINFVRDIKQVNIECNGDKRFVDDAQYRLTFDNHLILYHFLNQFKRGSVTLSHKDTTFACPITILDPIAKVANKHAPFEGTNYVYYVEKQLNEAESNEFHSSLHFKTFVSCVGGLLHPATFESNDTLCLHTPNTVTEMIKNCGWEDTSGQRLTKNQYKANQGFRLLYNRLYVDLSICEQTHVEYYEREKTLHCVGTPRLLPTPVKVVPVRKIDCSKPTESVRKNQPTLRCVVQKIPEESKRRQETVPEIIPAKKQRVETQKIDKFFTK